MMQVLFLQIISDCLDLAEALLEPFLCVLEHVVAVFCHCPSQYAGLLICFLSDLSGSFLGLDQDFLPADQSPCPVFGSPEDLFGFSPGFPSGFSSFFMSAADSLSDGSIGEGVSLASMVI